MARLLSQSVLILCRTVEFLVNNELGRMWKEAVIASWRAVLEYVWKSTKILHLVRYSNQAFLEYNSEALPLVRRFVPCDQLSNVTNGSYLRCQRSWRARDLFLFCITCSKQRPIVSVVLWQVTRCYSVCRTEAPAQTEASSWYEPWYARRLCSK